MSGDEQGDPSAHVGDSALVQKDTNLALISEAEHTSGLVTPLSGLEAPSRDPTGARPEIFRIACAVRKCQIMVIRNPNVSVPELYNAMCVGGIVTIM